MTSAEPALFLLPLSPHTRHPIPALPTCSNLTSAETWNFLRVMGVPTNKLHACGYISIGCEPCTRPVLPNQHEREGRWWWEDATGGCGCVGGGGQGGCWWWEVATGVGRCILLRVCFGCGCGRWAWKGRVRTGNMQPAWCGSVAGSLGVLRKGVGSLGW